MYMENTGNINRVLDELKLNSTKMDALLINRNEIARSLIKAIEFNINDIEGEKFRGKSAFKKSLELLKVNVEGNSENKDNYIKENYSNLNDKVLNINTENYTDYSMGENLAYARSLGRQINNIDSWHAPMKKTKTFYLRKSSKANADLLNLLKEYNNIEENIASLQCESEILINDINKNHLNTTLSKVQTSLDLNNELYDPTSVLADYGSGFEVLREGTTFATSEQFARSYQQTGNLGLSMHRTAQVRVW